MSTNALIIGGALIVAAGVGYYIYQMNATSKSSESAKSSVSEAAVSPGIVPVPAAPSLAPAPTTTPICKFLDGTFVQFAGDPNVFVMEGGQRHLVPYHLRAMLGESARQPIVVNDINDILTCPEGAVCPEMPASFESPAHCDAFANEYLKCRKKTPGRPIQVGSWSHVPPGCSVQSKGDWTAHWNQNPNGTNDGSYTPFLPMQSLERL